MSNSSSSSNKEKKVLVVGGTGYLGQHLLQGFAENHETCHFSLAFTHHKLPPPPLLLQAIPQALPFQVDLKTGDGFDSILEKFGQPDVVVNCAVLVPPACEIDPAGAMSINVPSTLVRWMSSFGNDKVLLIHMSSDQVYEGTKSFYKEEDETVPVNVYGKSKLAAEELIIKSCSNYAILRSSIIYGPQTISPVLKPLIIQMMDNVLAKGEIIELFHDEYRCPVYVKDVVTIMHALTIRWISEGKQMQVLLNVGGLDSVSRVQMAEAVAHVRGYETSLIKPVSTSSVVRSVKSPADISMDTNKLIRTLDISLTNLLDGVRLMLKC